MRVRPTLRCAILSLAACSASAPGGATPVDPGSARAAPKSSRSGPAPDELVDLLELAPSIRLEIRYATTENFTGVKVYPVARCLLRRAVAERLAAVQRELGARGLGLLVWDCYRPFSVQQKFWKLVPDSRYVARPVKEDGVPVRGSKHNRGAAVDLTLITADGQRLEMPTGFDDFSARAHRDYQGSSPRARRNMKTLERVMVKHGFEPLPTEWWHFDGPGWRRYPIADRPLPGG